LHRCIIDECRLHTCTSIPDELGEAIGAAAWRVSLHLVLMSHRRYTPIK
jgi:hypothetical protein